MAKSALGDYVHYKTLNYQKYGIAKRDSGSTLQYFHNKMVTDKINKLSSVGQETIQEMKKRIAENSTAQERADMSAEENQANERLKTIVKMVESTASSSAVNSYLYASSNGTSTNYWMTAENFGDTVKKSTAGTRNTVQKKIDAKNKLETLLQTIETAGMATDAQMKQILSYYNIIYGTNKTSIKNMKSVLGQVQAETDEMHWENSEQAVAGNFGEMIVASVGDTAYNSVADELETEIKTAVVGRETGSFAINKKDIVSSYSTTDASQDMFTIHNTQNKVDVKIQIKGEQINASVKNYRSNHNVALQNVSLIYALIALNKSGWSNHWLNMHSLNGTFNNQQDADETVKKELIYEALVSGNPLKKNNTNANTFVYMNRNLGTVEIYNTKDLLTDLTDMIQMPNDISNIHFTNKWIGSGNKPDKKLAQERIASVINQIHKQKIQVLFKPKSLTL